MIFYTVIRFNLYRNGSVRKYQRLYKTPRKFKTKEKAVRYANELFKNKNCLCIHCLLYTSDAADDQAPV